MCSKLYIFLGQIHKFTIITHSSAQDDLFLVEV